MPGKGALGSSRAWRSTEKQLGRTEAVISSMTVEERRTPLSSTAVGAADRPWFGQHDADVNALLKEFEQARKMMKSMMGGGRRMPKLPGGFPGMPGMGARPSPEGARDVAVRIRLRRLGARSRPFYRVVVADQRSPRDGRFIEAIGKTTRWRIRRSSRSTRRGRSNG